MAWFYLIIGGMLEIGWAVGLKFSKGFTEVVPSIVTVILIILSFYFFSQAMKRISVGTAYAIFTGIGAAGTAIIGMVFLGEYVSFFKILFIVLLLACIICLKLASNQQEQSVRDAK
jgi:quaternary ammonium compound-resistance protein SugE